MSTFERIFSGFLTCSRPTLILVASAALACQPSGPDGPGDDDGGDGSGDDASGEGDGGDGDGGDATAGDEDPSAMCSIDPDALTVPLGQEFDLTVTLDIDLTEVHDADVYDLIGSAVTVSWTIEDPMLIRPIDEDDVIAGEGTSNLDALSLADTYTFEPELAIEFPNLFRSVQTVKSACAGEGTTDIVFNLAWAAPNEMTPIFEDQKVVGIDCKDDGGGSPGYCESTCSDVQDCCGGFPECPGPFPANWECNDGFCEWGGCSDDSECPDVQECIVIDGVGICFDACTMESDCDLFGPDITCSGVGDNGMDKFCKFEAGCNHPDVGCGSAICDRVTGDCICNDDSDCTDMPGLACKQP